MAKNTKFEIPKDLVGTVEGKALEHFHREKEAYEEATGKKVKYVPPMPVTRTPIATAAEEKTLSAMTKAELAAEAEKRGVTVTPAMTKAQIVEAIETAANDTDESADTAGSADPENDETAEGDE